MRQEFNTDIATLKIDVNIDLNEFLNTFEIGYDHSIGGSVKWHIDYDFRDDMLHYTSIVVDSIFLEIQFEAYFEDFNELELDALEKNSSKPLEFSNDKSKVFGTLIIDTNNNNDLRLETDIKFDSQIVPKNLHVTPNEIIIN